MAASRKPQDTEIEYYEGLVVKTASMIAPYVEMEFEDIAQMLRYKVWRGIESFDPAKSKVPRRSYVFSCVVNQKKDILARKRRGVLYIEDLVSNDDGDQDDGFHGDYLSVDTDVAYAEVENEAIALPATLNFMERQVVLQLYLGTTPMELSRQLGISVRRLNATIAEVRAKMADWRPEQPEVRSTVAA